jgi:hypothetical protein
MRLARRHARYAHCEIASIWHKRSGETRFLGPLVAPLRSLT